MISGRGEVDIVFYLEPNSVDNWKGSDFRRELRHVFLQAQQFLPGSKQHRRKFRAVRLILNGTEVDILLGLEHITPMTILEQEVEWWKEQGGHFHQKLNNLVKLAKHWISKDKAKRKLCPSYALELMVIKACKNSVREDSYEELFTKLMKWIVRSQLKGEYSFTKYYQMKDLHQFPKNRLSLWDPADPTNNIATRYNGLSNKRCRNFLEYAIKASQNIDSNNWNFLL